MEELERGTPVEEVIEMFKKQDHTSITAYVTKAIVFNYSKRDDKYKPGPAAYKIKNLKKFGNIPILIKSRLGFFYDDDLKIILPVRGAEFLKATFPGYIPEQTMDEINERQKEIDRLTSLQSENERQRRV